MSIFNINLPDAFTDYIEQTYYAQVTEQSKLAVVVQDPDFLRDPLKHVALFSDHGILHGRDIAAKISQVIEQIHGLLIPQRSLARLEFMLGYGAILAYLHDIGMKHFSAFGRAMHPEFAAQLMFSPEFDPWIDLLWRENAGNVPWRLINLAVPGVLTHEPQLVLREMLALSMGHSKSKVPIEILNHRPRLRTTMHQCLGTELHYLYHQQRVTRVERQLAQTSHAEDAIRLKQQLAVAEADLATFVSRTPAPQRLNPDIERIYGQRQRFEQTAFSWLLADTAELQQLTLDVIDTVRALRCADALRQRGTAFTTSAGYQVFTSPDTANAIYALERNDRGQLFLLEGKDPISAGEANIANSNLDRDGNLWIAFTRGKFASPEATQWAAYSAAVVIQDIQADVIGSFRRSEADQAQLESPIKPEQEMQILIEGVDDNPEFANLVCQQLRQLNPDLSHRLRPVTSLQYADLAQVNRYLDGRDPRWSLNQKLSLLDRLVQTGHKVDHIDLDQAFAETRLITLQAGEVLMTPGSLSGFVYIPLGVGLRLFMPQDNQIQAGQPWVPLGQIDAIRHQVTSIKVVAEQSVDLLMIPKQIYRHYWHESYTVDEFTHLFAHGGQQPQLPTRRATAPGMDLLRLNRRSRALPLAMHWAKLFPQDDQLKQFMTYWEKLRLAPEAVLFSQGQVPQGIYLIGTGPIDLLDSASAAATPIQTLGAGDLVGSWEFYSQLPYQHTARAQKASTLYGLSAAALAQMQTEAPHVAHRFSQHLLELLALQLGQANRDIALLRQNRTETVERLTTLDRI